MMNNNKENNGFTWIYNKGVKGVMSFTFDGEHVFNLFRDYPYELSPEQKKEFDSVNPFWAEFFKDRCKEE